MIDRQRGAYPGKTRSRVCGVRPMIEIWSPKSMSPEAYLACVRVGDLVRGATRACP